jgi:hypothetical protein
MSEVLVVVTAQYIDENGKPKGGQIFKMRADADIFTYGNKDEIVSIIQKMIDETMMKWSGKYQYIEHELVFNEPVDLKGDFNEMYNEFK